MKKLLSILGCVFLVLLLGFGGFVGYAAYQGRALDASGKAYVEANVPPILSSWSKEELLKRSSPQLRKIADEKPEQVDQLFKKLRTLGAMRSFGEVKGDANISYTTQKGKAVTASYIAKAMFDQGEARVTIRLIQSSADWQLLFFHVDSPFFLQ